MAVIFADIVVNDIASAIAEPVQNVESRGNRVIQPAPFACDETQVGNEDRITGNEAVSFATVAPYHDESANGSTTAHVDEGDLATRSNVKDIAEEDIGPVLIKQPLVRPAQTVFDTTGSNVAGNTSAIVAELAVVDTVDSSEARVNISAKNFKAEAVSLSEFTQS